MKHLSVLLIVIAGAAYAQGPATTQPAAAAGPVIVKIVGRDTTITASASPNGPVYSVNTAQGTQIVPPMTIDQLQAQRPDLAKQVRTMNTDASIGAWAGVD